MENIRNFFTFCGIWGLLYVAVVILNAISDAWASQNITGYIFAMILTYYIYDSIQAKTK